MVVDKHSKEAHRTTPKCHMAIYMYIDVYVSSTIWGFPKIRGTILGVAIIRAIVCWGLYWGPLI